jgi:S1-C subfamily serine protease
MVRVLRVQPDSIAAELGIVPGTELLSVDGRALEDFLDWEFLTADDAFELEAKLPTGST